MCCFNYNVTIRSLYFYILLQYIRNQNQILQRQQLRKNQKSVKPNIFEYFNILFWGPSQLRNVRYGKSAPDDGISLALRSVKSINVDFLSITFKFSHSSTTTSVVNFTGRPFRLMLSVLSSY